MLVQKAPYCYPYTLPYVITSLGYFLWNVICGHA